MEAVGGGGGNIGDHGKPDLAFAAGAAAHPGLVALSADAVLRRCSSGHGRRGALGGILRGCRLGLVGARVVRLFPLWLRRAFGGVPSVFRASELRGASLGRRDVPPAWGHDVHRGSKCGHETCCLDDDNAFARRTVGGVRGTSSRRCRHETHGIGDSGERGVVPAAEAAASSGTAAAGHQRSFSIRRGLMNNRVKPWTIVPGYRVLVPLAAAVSGVVALVSFAILPLFLQPVLANEISNKVDNCDKLIEQFVDSTFSYSNQKPDRNLVRRIENVDVFIEGIIAKKTRNYVLDVANEIQNILPLSRPDNYNTVVMFREDVKQEILSNEEIQTWLGVDKGELDDLVSQRDSLITICRHRLFERKEGGDISGYYMLVTNNETHEKQVRECILDGFLKSIGLVGNLGPLYGSDAEDNQMNSTEDDVIIGRRIRAMIELLYSDYVEIGQTPEEVSEALSNKSIEFCHLTNGALNR